MILGTWGSITIIDTPRKPSMRDVSISMFDANSVNTSPYSQQTQIQRWPGSDLISGHFSLPPLSNTQAGAWRAWLADTAGMGNYFLLGDPSCAQPQGNPEGAPTVAQGIPRSQQLLTRGWEPGVSRLLLPGDWIQVGTPPQNVVAYLQGRPFQGPAIPWANTVRLHMVLDQVDSDGGGNAMLRVWPSIREAPEGGLPIITHNPKGLFRLAKNQRKYDASLGKIFGVEFDIQEAR